MEDFQRKLIDGLAELKTTIASGETSRRAMQTQLDALDRKIAERSVAYSGGRDLVEFLKANPSVQSIMGSTRSAKSASFQLTPENAPALFERKTTISSSAVGQAVTGVLQIERIPGITAEAREQLTIRDLLPARPTQLQIVDFVKVSQPLTVGSPAAESSTKPEGQLNFTSVSEKVRVIAITIPASRQILDDFTELAGFLNSSLQFYVDLGEEQQLLSGDGTGENIHGLITQATAFNTGLLVAGAGWNKLDIIGRAIEQIRIAKEVQPTFVVLNPRDWWDMRLTKDSFGRYILGDPQQMVRATLFGLDVDPTTSIAQGTFLVGSGNPVCVEIRDRMELQIDISTEHASFFIQNLVMIRAEKRLALVVKRPASFITGSFSTSP